MLENITHKTKFNDNSSLFINSEQFKEDNDTDEEDKSSGSWKKFKNGIL